MKFANKEFEYYWDIIKIPLALLIGWSIVGIVIAKISIYLFNSIFSGIAGLIVQLAILGFVGYYTIAEKQGQPINSVWSGVLIGVLAGIAGAILNIIAIYLVPEIIDQAVAQAVARGAPEADVRQMINITQYISFITGPLFGGILGAIISGISGLITKKVIKK
jgi:MFS family permease